MAEGERENESEEEKEHVDLVYMFWVSSEELWLQMGSSWKKVEDGREVRLFLER